AALRDLLPKGNTLDDETFRRRHWLVCSILGFHLPAIAALGLRNEQESIRYALQVGLPMAFLYVALHSKRRRVQGVAATAGLAACSMVLVDLLDGSYESRFHVFVVVGFVALYQDWFPYLCVVAASA